MMTEFQEGRTYLVILFSQDEAREVRIVTGEPRKYGLLGGDDGDLYEDAVGPLALKEYNEACYLIRNRDWFLEARAQATVNIERLAGSLLDLWRELA